MEPADLSFQLVFSINNFHVGTVCLDTHEIPHSYSLHFFSYFCFVYQTVFVVDIIFALCLYRGLNISLSLYIYVYIYIYTYKLKFVYFELV